MLFAFLFGLTGSLGHCVGMCSGVMLLLSRRGITSGWRMLLAHLGRITTYSLSGFLAGALGLTLSLALPDLRLLQGVLALVVAVFAGYFALALMGRVPSPEGLLTTLTRRWGTLMRRLTMRQSRRAQQSPPAPVVFGLGLAWGLLPCGLVLTALLAAAASGSPGMGALTLLAFGLGTLPAFVGMYWLSRLEISWSATWARHTAVLVVFLFSGQMALRGLAAWGWVGHLRVGSVMVW